MIIITDRSSAHMPSESLAGITNVSNFRAVRKQNADLHMLKLDECLNIWQEVRNGNMPDIYLKAAFQPQAVPELFSGLQRLAPHVFSEEMTIGDFGSLTDNVLNRAMLANYVSAPSTYKQICKINNNVKDFRQIRLYAQDSGEGVFDAVLEGANFNRRKFTQSVFNYSVVKYEAGMAMSWESVINDDLGLWDDIPVRLGQGGVNSIQKYATSLYTGATGLNTLMYDGTNTVTSNAALDLTALGTAMTQMLSQVDADGNPIVVGNFKLVVGPALFVKAMNLKKMIMGVDVIGGNAGLSATKIRVEPWLPAMFDVVLDPWIPIIATTNGATTWFLFNDPNVGRPAIQLGFLSGFSEPQLFKKISNTARMGGGIAQEMGDFDTMAQEYKAMMVYGGIQVDKKSTMGSNGSGS